MPVRSVNRDEARETDAPWRMVSPYGFPRWRKPVRYRVIPHDVVSDHAGDEVEEVFVEGDVEEGRVALEMGAGAVGDVDVRKLLGAGVGVGRDDFLQCRAQHRHAFFGDAKGGDDVTVIFVGSDLVAGQGGHGRLRIPGVAMFGRRIVAGSPVGFGPGGESRLPSSARPCVVRHLRMM